MSRFGLAISCIPLALNLLSHRGSLRSLRARDSPSATWSAWSAWLSSRR